MLNQITRIFDGIFSGLVALFSWWNDVKRRFLRRLCGKIRKRLLDYWEIIRDFFFLRFFNNLWFIYWNLCFYLIFRVLRVFMLRNVHLLLLKEHFSCSFLLLFLFSLRLKIFILLEWGTDQILSVSIFIILSSVFSPLLFFIFQVILLLFFSIFLLRLSKEALIFLLSVFHLPLSFFWSLKQL